MNREDSGGELTFKEYEQATRSTKPFKHSEGVTYCVLGILGEAGEVVEKRKKQLRGDHNPSSTEDIKKELGAVLRCLSTLAKELGTTLEEVARSNIEKISSRQQRGVVKGSGDDR